MRWKTASQMLLLLACALPAAAQLSAHPTSTNGPSRASNPSPAPNITFIGQASVLLNGPWKFHPGDDPLWSSPEFDDAQWEAMDLTPPPNSHNPGTGRPGYVPGWNSKGHPGLIGFAWYRTHLQLTGNVEHLSVLIRPPTDDVYQVFANGQYIGAFGDFSPRTPVIYGAQPRMFGLPRLAPGERLVLAFRFYMTGGSLLANHGGFHSVPMLGETPVVLAEYKLAWSDRLQKDALTPIVVLIMAGFALLFFGLYILDRSDKVLLWLTVASLLALANELPVPLTELTTYLPQFYAIAITTCVLFPLSFAVWPVVWCYWLHARRRKRIFSVVLLAAACMCLYTSVALAYAHLGHPPQEFLDSTFSILEWTERAAMLLLLLWIASNRSPTIPDRKFWLTVPLLFCSVLAVRAAVRDVMSGKGVWFPLGVAVKADTVFELVLFFSFGFLALRRFQHTQRAQQEAQQELQQAQEVQQVLLPEPGPGIPGFAVEREYLPARVVGGDFFQVIPVDDGLLVVIGDVAGKGLFGAMMVAVLVGAIRTEMQHTVDPAQLLAVLNSRMCGRPHGGFATCLVAHISGAGKLHLANAGHLPPYLNGAELQTSNELPLGVQPGLRYETATVTFSAGDRLTLISDGVVEAQNARRELFGFERARAISNKPAREIAQAAIEFGQEDDITVLTVSRL